MYNTIEVMVLEIKKAEINLFKKGGLNSEYAENVKHVKVLPYLSIVQSLEGSYDITLGNGEMMQTGDGGFFVAPSGVQQTIVHHINKKSGRMVCRWIFIDAEINRAYKLDSLYQLPVLLDEDSKKEMNKLFDLIFSTDDFWELHSCCYKAISIILQTANPRKSTANKGIQRAVDHIIDNYSKPISISELASISNMSESNLYASFKKQFGTSPIVFLNNFRLSLALERLVETDDTVKEISYSVGITDPLYFSRLFKKSYGVSPREYRLTNK